MIEDLSFDGNPEFATAFRFMFWSLFAGLSAVALVSARYCKQKVWAPSVIPYGVFLICVGLSVHQFYYWMVHRARSHQNAEILEGLGDVRHITSIMLIVMCVGGFMYASFYMKSLVGRYWAPCSVAVMVALWIIGYVDARWQ